MEKPKRIKFFILLKKCNLLDIHNDIVLCDEMLFQFFTLMIFIDKKKIHKILLIFEMMIKQTLLWNKIIYSPSISISREEEEKKTEKEKKSK